ncbi:hypothetical protein Tco_0173390 [Tanacetum coccineum]
MVHSFWFLSKVSSRCEPLAADIKDVVVSRNVRRRLLASHSSMPMNTNVLSGTAELCLGPANTIQNCGSSDKNSVLISRIFDRFRNMHMDNIQADCRSDIPVNAISLLMSSGERFPAIGIIRSHDIFDGTVVPISRSFDRFRNMGMDNFQSSQAKVLRLGTELPTSLFILGISATLASKGSACKNRDLRNSFHVIRLRSSK